MRTEFSQDIFPLSDLKINLGKVVKHTKDTHRPILVTSRGRGVAVVQGLEEYEKNEEELAFVKAVAQGLMDAKEGKSIDIDEAKKQIGIL